MRSFPLLVLCLSVVIPALSNAVGFTGNRVQMQVTYGSIDTLISTPFVATVGDEAEFTDLPSGDLPGDCCFLIDFVIDLTESTIVYDFSSVDPPSGLFASGPFNGYLFTDLDGTIPAITGVSVAPGSTFGLTDSRVSFTQDQIFVDVSDLEYDQTRSAILNVTFVPEPSTFGLVLLGLIGFASRRRISRLRPH